MNNKEDLELEDQMKKNEIQNREGFFKLSKRLRNAKQYNNLDEENVKLEKGDFLAMLISALYTIVIPVLLFMGIFVFLIFLIFRGF